MQIIAELGGKEYCLLFAKALQMKGLKNTSMKYYKIKSQLISRPTTKIVFCCDDENRSFEAIIFREIPGHKQAQFEKSEARLEIEDCHIITEKEYKAAYEEANYINSL